MGWDPSFKYPQPDCPFCSDDFLGLIGTSCEGCGCEGKLVEKDSECYWCEGAFDREELNEDQSCHRCRQKPDTGP